MARGLLSSGSGGSGDIDSDDFIGEGNDVQLLKLVSSILGAFVALWVGVWIEAMATVVSIHVWIINGIGDFLAEVVTHLLGTPAVVQVRAWETTFEATVSEPLLQPFILAAEALVLFWAFYALRDRGVLP